MGRLLSSVCALNICHSDHFPKQTFPTDFALLAAGPEDSNGGWMVNCLVSLSEGQLVSFLVKIPTVESDCGALLRLSLSPLFHSFLVISVLALSNKGITELYLICVLATFFIPLTHI